MTDQLTTLAQRVKKLRLERGWSQAQLAEKIGANPSVIGRCPRGGFSMVANWQKCCY